jgi:alkylglycerol monooxygenase
MDLLALAVPFFVLALIVEIAVDRWRGTGYYRVNDAINSISTSVLMTTTGYFTRLLPLFIYGFVLQKFALFNIDISLFDTSPRGLSLWLAALLAWDFCYYWAHRFGHEISILWASHAVHHQSEDYNLSTALRQTSTGFLFTWVFYVPLFLIGLPIEVVVTVNAVDLIYQFWVHTQHIGKLGMLDRILVTPSNHRVHHAQNSVYIDRNYGGIFIIWDRLFGTFQEELDEEPVVFGVRKPLRSWNPIWANFQVFNYLWFDAVNAKRWRDKLGIWFRRTGWRPEDVETSYPKKHADLGNFHRFDPESSLAIQRYTVTQFIFVILGIVWIGVLFAEQGAEATLLPCLILWMTLYTLGLLNEGRARAIGFETARLLIFVPLIVATMSTNNIIEGSLQNVAGFTAVYVFGSLSGLWLAGKDRSISPTVNQ